MPFIESKTKTDPVKIFYTDLGQGKPLVFIHGWPLSHAMWEYQLAELPAVGYRCVAYFARIASNQPGNVLYRTGSV